MVSAQCHLDPRTRGRYVAQNFPIFGTRFIPVWYLIPISQSHRIPAHFLQYVLHSTIILYQRPAMKRQNPGIQDSQNIGVRVNEIIREIRLSRAPHSTTEEAEERVVHSHARHRTQADWCCCGRRRAQGRGPGAQRCTCHAQRNGHVRIAVLRWCCCRQGM